jgi:hypothetical protein
MGKGDRQRSNRETKKPKTAKKAQPTSTTFLKPETEARKPDAKPTK